MCSTLVFPVGGVDLVRMESRSARALEELAIDGAVDWNEDKEGPPTEEGAELVEMGVASGMDADCGIIVHVHHYTDISIKMQSLWDGC